MDEIALRARRAAGWSFAEVFLRQLVQLVISIWMARILAPEDFGALALISLFLSIAGIFVDGGLSQALIQKSAISQYEIASVFWFNVITSLLLVAAVTFSASFIAKYFKSEIIAPLISFMALNILLVGVQSVHRAMLTKALNFKALGVASLVSSVFSGGISIYLAISGFGVWSLAWQAVISAALSGLILVFYYRIPRVFIFNFSVLISLLRFGSWILLGSILNAMRGGFITLLLGKFFSLRDLGLYSRAEGTKNIPIGLLSASLERVILPVLAKVGSDRARLNRGARRALLLMMLFNVPAMMGVAVSSDMLLATLFGAKWLDAAPYLSILCIAAIFTPLGIINVQLLLSLGFSKEFFYLDLAKFFLAVVVTVVASAWGVLALAWAQVLIAIVSWIINANYSNRLASYGFGKQFLDVLPTIATGCIASAVALFFKSFSDVSGISGLFLIALIWSAVFIALAVLIRLESVTEVRLLVVSLIGRLKNN